MICPSCRTAADTRTLSRHDECLGGTQCMCQHAPVEVFLLEVPAEPGTP